ncbi:MAG: ATP-dependent DNA ligase [Acidimicrobiales bacterium]
MDLPVMPPLAPMLAKSSPELPEAEPGAYWFEPKWDGFRCLVFRDGDEIELGSRNDRPLTRYFPELLGPLRASLPERCVVDGEVVVVGPDGLDFDALQQRIHPAESRVNRLAAETPASFVAFDLVALGDRSLMAEPLSVRRELLEQAITPSASVHVTPGTYDRAVAQDWFSRFEGAGLDGVMAKAATGTYQPNKRAQLKVKHLRTADCVVAGFREHKDGTGPGSLLLGLWDDEGNLHHLGVASSFSAARRKELRAKLAPYVTEDWAEHPWGRWAEVQAQVAAEGGRMPGNISRWNAQKDLSFTALRPELVAEVAYERVDNGRFRHSCRFQRWRPDRDPASCTFEQLEVVPPVELHQVFGPGEG